MVLIVGKASDQLDLVRASVAARVDRRGDVVFVPADALRLDYDPVTHEPLGALIEPASTNYVKNNTNHGQVGTALPSTWSNQNAIGLSHEVSTGVEKGLPFTRIRVFGTVATGNIHTVFFVHPLEDPPATAQGEKWTVGLYGRLVAAPKNTARPPTILFREYANTSTNGNHQYELPLTSEFLPYQATHTIAGGATNRLGCGVAIRIDGAGQEIDITYDIFPWVEDRAFLTSPTLTAGARETRAGDLLACDVSEGARAFALAVNVRGVDAEARQLLNWHDGSLANRYSLAVNSAGTALDIEAAADGVVLGSSGVAASALGQHWLYGVIAGGHVQLGRIGTAEPAPASLAAVDGIDTLAIGGTGLDAAANAAAAFQAFIERPIADFATTADGYAWAKSVAQAWADA